MPTEPIDENIARVLARLKTSQFRRKFRLLQRERNYLLAKGLPIVLRHAADFIQARLAPAQPPNDGKQTPWRGHPVFIAQHATATCCRGCLEKWHRIPRGQELTPEQQGYVVNVIRAWLREQQAPPSTSARRVES